ncbi:MAG: 4-phosphopantoate--beta-alanine ligase, partial [Wenzhouxiangella sp.]
MTLQIVENLTELRELRDGWRRAGKRVGLVPTMGNLHGGHLELVRSIQSRVDRTVASIFVNPTQFGPGEDFERYPRTRQADLEQLEAAGCTLAWLPSVEQMYPLPESFRIQPPASLVEILCGQDRPGHFDGVASVVLRLFNQLSPEAAIFGEKDFQQLLVIRQMVEDLAL